MIQSLLIANRGEIACRIIRTARRMGVRTVAVFSDADRNALHVRQADDAVHIGPSPARESYLVGERIIAAALESGAQAIHPGYGFLSENADFAQDVIDAGLIWVGPRPDSIRAMGLKNAAKARMIAAGVPVTPGYLGEDQSPERLQAEAYAIGYPVLIKAVAGGGGKGMRRVDAAAAFADALASCRREAASSFGDDRVLIEKYILSPRHIEVQVFGDAHGNVVHLFERDCSLQRRHQKVIEEAPAPGMDEVTRAAVCGAAVRAAQAVNYEGAGTIEFIADASEGLRADRVWFMEMNTRLQVEHPVTEMITGVDLVEWQLRVASGEALPKRQDQLSINGWAMEARLYAEDPAKGFLPSVGRLDILDFSTSERVDAGVSETDVISPFYDPMIAKVIVHRPDRAEAAAELARAVGNIMIWPVRTNAGFLTAALSHPEFTAAIIDTGFIARNEDALVVRPDANDKLWLYAARELTGNFKWTPLNGFRLNAPGVDQLVISLDGVSKTVDLQSSAHPDPLAGGIGLASYACDGGLAIIRNGHSYLFQHQMRGSGHHSLHDGDIVSPMPGRVIAVEVAAGQAVTKGQTLLVLEAMKMEHALVAPFDGTVTELNVQTGAQVQVDALLVRVEAE
ncbi:acetyl/propionyl/methylcrotonyl-CoA carboxylase subunit alpha [Novosphingobium sp. FKTRR1]|uniref:acetyl/propionyl/methylcrotonyl-CoA carboxylase subunit alpha n=1 Tax=Novosphingobium sp. FKTRR1 TaxID=2879118 RepID=UPI001CF06EF3|nr:acetyl/propionyl/methylcrotonyl-CoA carboxylase subunit alpha [Novosphingobium sp. FKTRR1]